MREALAVQGRVLNALVLREITARFGQTYFGYAWALVNPLLGVLVLFLVFSSIDRLAPADIPLLMFLVTGYLTWTHFTATYERVHTAAGSNAALLHFPHVTVLDVILGRGILEILTFSMVLFIFTIASALVVENSLPAAPKLALLAFWSAGLGGLAMGTIIAALKPYMRSLDNLISPVLKFGFFTSGVFFTAADLPYWVLPYLSWNPMFHVIESVRELWFQAYTSPIADPAYVVRILTIGVAFAFLLERFSRRRQTI